MKRTYETDDDYILDILEGVVDELTEELANNLPDNMQFEFAKFLAVRNAIENINTENAFKRAK